MKLQDVKNKIDNYFDNIDSIYLYKLLLKYNFEVMTTEEKIKYYENMMFECQLSGNLEKYHFLKGMVKSLKESLIRK